MEQISRQTRAYRKRTRRQRNANESDHECQSTDSSELSPQRRTSNGSEGASSPSRSRQDDDSSNESQLSGSQHTSMQEDSGRKRQTLNDVLSPRYESERSHDDVDSNSDEDELPYERNEGDGQNIHGEQLMMQANGLPIIRDPDSQRSGEDEIVSSDVDQNGASDSQDEHDDGDSERDSLSGEDEDEDDENFNDDNEPLYNGAQITVRESLLAILTFAQTHKLTGQCLNDLLTLIALHCSPNNLCIKSLYKFKHYFNMIGKNNVTLHYFCTECEVSLESKDSICVVCNANDKVSYFIELPVVSQLQSMYKRPGFYESLRFKDNRVKKNNDNIEDVYDGCMYRNLTANGFFNNPDNISFFKYFDGVALFKSSNFSIWPIYLAINELQYSQRTKKENIILAAVWFGKSKPNPNLFLQPLHATLNMLEHTGAEMTLSNGEKVMVRGKLLAAVGDMPAKSLFMRLVQFNGAFSCFNCMAQGGRYDVGNTTIQVYPYSRNVELRDNNDINNFAQQAIIARQNDPEANIYGIKGPSLLSVMLPNMVLCMGCDIMHGLFLGVMKTILNLWFDTKYSGFPFSVSAFVNIVDIRLKAIKPPYSFKVPRSIKKEIKLMKAYDFKVFMFYYSLPVLLGILPEIYWIHHSKIVTAASILCQESISLQQLDEAEELLHSYVADFENLYGLRYLSLTFHQLIHLSMIVRNLGPAWVYSCFFYESLNGQLARLVHGSRYAALQICSSCSVYMNLSVLISSMEEGSLAKALCLKFQERTKQKVTVTENIDHQSYVVGKLKLCYPVPGDIRKLVQDSFDIHDGRYKYFYRLKKKGTVYSSETYVRSKQKKSCYVEIFENDVPYLCKIQHFIKWSSCNNCPIACVDCPKRYLCIVQLFERVPWELHDAPLNVTLSYLDKVSPTQNICVFPVQSIRSVCLHISIGEAEYISVPVNSLEVE